MTLTPDAKPAEPLTPRGGHRLAGQLRLRLVGLRRRRRQRTARPVRGGRARHLGEEERAASGCSTSGSRRCAPSTRSRCRTGVPTSRASTSTTSSTSCAPARSRPRPGTTCPPTSRTPTTGSASRRPRSSAWSPVWPRSTSASPVTLWCGRPIADRCRSRRSPTATGFSPTTRTPSGSSWRRSRPRRRPIPGRPTPSERRDAVCVQPTTTRCWSCATSASRVGSGLVMLVGG